MYFFLQEKYQSIDNNPQFEGQQMSQPGDGWKAQWKDMCIYMMWVMKRHLTNSQQSPPAMLSPVQDQWKWFLQRYQQRCWWKTVETSLKMSNVKNWLQMSLKTLSLFFFSLVNIWKLYYLD